MYAEVNRIVDEKYPTESEKELRQQNKTPSGKMDGFTAWFLWGV